MRNKVLSFAIPAALVLCAGIAAVAYTGGDHCKAKADKASTAASSCVKATDATAAGSCAASKAQVTTASAGCNGAKATQAGGSSTAAMKAGSGMSCGTSATTTAENHCTFPEGTKYSQVSVPGGVDMIFTGPNLAGVETTLRTMAGACGDKADCGKVCSVTSTATSVVFSVRGENAEACCRAISAGSMVTASAGDKDACVTGATAAGDKSCCPSKGAAGVKTADVKASKPIVKSS